MLTNFKDFASLLEAVEDTINDEPTVAADAVDTVTFDIPLMIRMFEVVREDIKTDTDLHKLVEKIVAIKDRGTLTMNDYADIVVTAEDAPSNE